MVTRTIYSDNSNPNADVVKYGAWYGNQQTNADGLLNGRISTIVVLTGVDTSVVDSSGNYRTYDSGATINSLSGLRAGATLMQRINNAYFKTAVQLNNNTNMRVFAGLVAASAAPASSADPLNALEGIGLWFDSAVSADWKLYHNDNTGAGTVDALSPTVAANTATLYPVEIMAVTDSKFTFIFQGKETDVSSNIPASTTNLGFRVYIENTTGASRVIRCYYVRIRNDK